MSKYKLILKSKLFLSIILFLFSLLCYLPSFKSDFVWDDIVYVKSQISILANFTPNVPFYLPPKSDSKPGGYFGIWRPVLYTSWALDAKLWGDNARGFHLTNNIMHALTTVSLFLLAYIILGEFNWTNRLKHSFYCAMLFALFPAHVETVSFISARSDLLCTLFVIISMIFFVLSYRSFYLILLSMPFFYLALLSKETAIFFPVLVISYALIRDYKYRKLSKKTIAFIGLFILILLLYYLARMRKYNVLPDFVGFNFAGPKLFSSVLLNYINYLFISLNYYISNLVYPVEFNVFVGKLRYSWINLISAYLLVILLTAFFILMVKRRKYLIVFSLIWILVTLIPAVGVSIINLTASPFSERFLYMPSVGYCMLLVLVTNEIVNFREYKAIKYLVISGIIVMFFIFNFKEQFVWRNSSTLWGMAVKRSPGYIAPHLNYGYALLETGDLQDAEKEFLIALEPSTKGRPVERANAAGNLGNLYIRQHKFDLAGQYFGKALQYDKKYKATYYYHMGLINYVRGNLNLPGDSNSPDFYYQKSVEYLLKSSKIAPKYGKLNLLIAEVYLKLGRPDKAVEYARRSLKSNAKGLLDSDMLSRAKQIINTY